MARLTHFFWFRSQRTFVITLTCLLLMGGGLAGGIFYAQHRVSSDVGTSLARVSEEIAVQIGQTLHHRSQEVRRLAEAAVFQSQDHIAVASYLTQVLQESSDFEWFGITDSEGRPLVSSGRAQAGKDWSRHRLIPDSTDKINPSIRVFPSSDLGIGEGLVSIIVPISGAKGAHAGFLSAHVPLSAFESIFQRALSGFQFQRGISGRSDWQLLTADGRVLMTSTLALPESGNTRPLVPYTTISDNPSPSGYVVTQLDQQQAPSMIGFAMASGLDTIPQEGLRVLVGFAYDDLMAPLYSSFWKVAAGAALVGIPLLVLLFSAGSRMKRLREKRDLLERALDAMNNGVMIMDATTPAHRVISLNHAFVRLTRFDPKAVLGRSGRFLEGPETDQRATKEIEAALRDGHPCRTTAKLYRKDGKPFWGELSISPVQSRNGRGHMAIWEIADVSNHHQTMKTLSTTEARLQAVTDHVRDGLIVINRHGVVESMNLVSEHLFGYSAAEVMGQNVKLLFPPPDRNRHDQYATRYLGMDHSNVTGKSQTLTGQRKDGAQINLDVTFHEIQAGDEKQILAIIREMTERQRGEGGQHVLEVTAQFLAESSTIEQATPNVLQVLCESLRWDLGAMWTVDNNAHELRRQGTWQTPEAALLGVGRMTPGLTCSIGEGLAGRVWSTGEPEWVSEIPAASNGSASAAGSPTQASGAVACPITFKGRILGVLEFQSRTLRHADASIDPTLTAVCTQIGEFLARHHLEVENQHLQAQIRRSQKMEAIGNLAGGIAHDFNNTLTAILGFTELAFPSVPAASKARAHLHQVMKAGTRARDLVQQILTFSRQGEHQHAPVQLHLLVTEALRFLRPTIPSSIEIRQSLMTQSDRVLAEPTQIHQVLVNLCTNAEYAMRQTGGVLEIGMDSIEITTEYAGAHPALQPGPYVRLTIKDTGPGMAADVKERIFEPFFTTKPPGEASGMGLAVVQGIMTGHGGAVEVDSAPREGTTVRVYFPAVQETEPSHPPPVSSLPRGTERILFVDDEESIGELGLEMLDGLGYHTVVRTNPNEALQAFRTVPQRFDLVITDHTMPHMTGEALAEEILRIRPHLPIILLTGSNHPAASEKFRAVGIRACLRKPLMLRDLAVCIRGVLEDNAKASEGKAGEHEIISESLEPLTPSN